MKFDDEFFNIGYLDRLSFKDTLIHNINAKAKVIFSLLFVLTVMSFQKYEIFSLLPFFIFPIVFIAIGEIPVRYIMKRLIIVSPFVIFIGIFNPFLDRNVAFYFFGLPINYGVLSLVSILLKFSLTVSMLIILIATTSFAGVCYALRSFKIPEIFVNQLLFLYRYIFVLVEEAMRMARAKDMRSFGNKGTELRYYVRLAGTLLIRSIKRAERIYYAMLSRGYNGIMPYRKKGKLTYFDLMFLFVSIALLFLFRFYNVVEIVGNFAKGNVIK